MIIIQCPTGRETRVNRKFIEPNSQPVEVDVSLAPGVLWAPDVLWRPAAAYALEPIAPAVRGKGQSFYGRLRMSG